jgi:hypothetical protein
MHVREAELAAEQALGAVVLKKIPAKVRGSFQANAEAIDRHR